MDQNIDSCWKHLTELEPVGYPLFTAEFRIRILFVPWIRLASGLQLLKIINPKASFENYVFLGKFNNFFIFLVSVVDPKLLFSDPDPALGLIPDSDPDPACLTKVIRLYKIKL